MKENNVTKKNITIILFIFLSFVAAFSESKTTLFDFRIEQTDANDSKINVCNQNHDLNMAQESSEGKLSSIALSNIDGVDTQSINNKIEVLSHHGRIWGNPGFSTFAYTFKLLTVSEYQSQKPSDAFAFEAGFVAPDGTINISEPATTEQRAVFQNITQVALYYLCQSYMYHFYQTRNIPLLFKVGFPVFEAGIIPTDATIKTAMNAYGGSFSSFDVLNDRTAFINKNGLAVAGAFGEFMNIFKNWGYPMVTNISSTSFDVASYWFNVDNLTGLLGDFNRYLSYRFMEPNENLRIQKYMETEHFKYYTRPIDGTLNFPYFSDVTENAIVEYSNIFDVKFAEKLSYFTLPTCIDGEIEGSSCNGEPPVRVAGGTAWSSGMHSTCASTEDQLPLFYHMNRHELAHAFQGILPQGTVTAWLNEGFPQFCAAGPMNDASINEMRQSGIDCMANSVKYFGHRPTYEETRIYPSPDYGYYTLGYFFIDYQYRVGGYPLIKAIQMNDLAAYQSLGYASSQAFLEDFYFDFDIRVMQKPIVTLINPVSNIDEINPTVNISWTPLKAGIKLNVSVSTDDGENWTEVVNRTTNTSCTWNSGDISSRFFIKISAPDNLNISTTYGPFIKGDLNRLNIVSPINNNYFIAGDTLNVRWANTNVQNIQLEYSTNNGSDWVMVNNSIGTSSGVSKWIVPTNLKGTCKLKITDTNNISSYSESETFNIVTPNSIGGPYLYDKNTLLLLHFDNDLNNRSTAAPNALGNETNLTVEASIIPDLGKSYKTTSPISVPKHANLNLTGDWTIETWVKITSYNVSNNMYLFWKPGDTDAYQSNYSLEVNPWWGNVFYGYYFSALNNRIGLTGSSPALNEWYHVAFTRDTKNKLLRVIVHDKNRNQISLTDLTYSPTETLVSTKDLLIGSGLNGYIDEVRISNVVRSFIYTNIENLKEENIFRAYPNPTNDVIHLKMSEPSNVEIRIINPEGQIVQVRKSAMQEEEILDVSGLNKGVYFIQLIDSKRKYTQKIIKI